MRTRIVTLSENTASMQPGLLAEHGLSIYLETERARFLFDTGLSISAAHNADHLEIDLKGVPIALSHGHHDHTGGLAGILKKTGPTKIFCHPDVFAPKYRETHGKLRYVGIPYSREDLVKMGAIFDVARDERQIADGIWLTGEIPRVTDFEKPESHLFVMDPTKRVDPVIDDQAMVLETGKGLVIILGCAHSGIVNTVEYAKRITGVDEIAAVVGGTHLGFPAGDIDAGMARLSKTIDALKKCDVDLLGISHCTGPEAAAVLYAEFRNRFVFNSAGTIIEL